MQRMVWTGGAIVFGGMLGYFGKNYLRDFNKEFLEKKMQVDHLLFTSKLLKFRKFSNGDPMVEDIDCKYLELISDYLVFNLKSLPMDDGNLKRNISSGTCFVTSPMNDPSCEYIYLVTAAHCVINKEGKAKKVGLIPKNKEGSISNQKLKSNSGELIECQIICCEYDGDRDVDFAIMKCSRKEFLEKNGFTEIPSQYFVPKIGEFKENDDNLNNIIVGYPSKYKEYRDKRVLDYTFEKLNGLMMTYQKRPVFSFGRYLRTEKSNSEKADITIFTNTINKGFSGGPSIEWRGNTSQNDALPKFHGIVALFDDAGYGSFNVSNEEFRQAYFSHIEIPSTTGLDIKKAIEEYRK